MKTKEKSRGVLEGISKGDANEVILAADDFVHKMRTGEGK